MERRHDRTHRDPRRRGDRRPRRRPRPDPARPAGDLHGAGPAARRARRRRVGAPAPAGAGREGDQRPVRRHPRRAPGHRPQGRRRRRAEAELMLWVAAIALLVVVVPVVVVLLKGVLDAANSIVPSVEGIAAVAAAGSKDLDAVPLLLTTQDQIRQTVAGLADYGGSLDTILDDAS